MMCSLPGELIVLSSINKRSLIYLSNFSLREKEIEDEDIELVDPPVF
jgi:hypothetical protein